MLFVLVGEVEIIVWLVQLVVVIGQYWFVFQVLDSDGDGFISCEEVQVNFVLVDEFSVLDVKCCGKFDCVDFVGWLVDQVFVYVVGVIFWLCVFRILILVVVVCWYILVCGCVLG